MFLDNQITENEKCNLYAISKFLVEVAYNSERNCINEIRSFITGTLLDKYSNFDKRAFLNDSYHNLKL